MRVIRVDLITDQDRWLLLLGLILITTPINYEVSPPSSRRRKRAQTHLPSMMPTPTTPSPCDRKGSGFWERMKKSSGARERARGWQRAGLG